MKYPFRNPNEALACIVGYILILFLVGGWLC